MSPSGIPAIVTEMIENQIW